MRTALITGITGQDGSYLSQLLLGKGYQVIGTVRVGKEPSLKNLEHLGISHNIVLQECDLSDRGSIKKVIDKHDPDEIYNLAAQSSVGCSFSHPIETIEFNTISVLNLLETIKALGRPIRFYQASSSEMYGKVDRLPVNESTPMHPRSPYGVSKASAHWITVNYRESYGMFACCGILFNHESYLREESFFVKKVVSSAVRMEHGEQQTLKVGNLDLRRDFGYSPRYVEAMHMMLQRPEPSDYIICSGRSISLREIVEHVFSRLDLELSALKQDRELYRPADIDDIYGDNGKARRELKWAYDSSFQEVLDLLIAEEEAARSRS